MKKAECKAAIIALCSEWRSAPERSSLSTQDLDVGACLHWVESKSPELLRFRSVMPPREIAEIWIAAELRQSWKY